MKKRWLLVLVFVIVLSLITLNVMAQTTIKMTCVTTGDDAGTNPKIKGSDPYVQGSVTFKGPEIPGPFTFRNPNRDLYGESYKSDVFKESADECITDNYLIEYYCDGNVQQIDVYKCDCDKNKGACTRNKLLEPVSQRDLRDVRVCVETDGGDNIYLGGILNLYKVIIDDEHFGGPPYPMYLPFSPDHIDKCTIKNDAGNPDTHGLIEYYCDASNPDKYSSYKVECDGACYNNACTIAQYTNVENPNKIIFKTYNSHYPKTETDGNSVTVQEYNLDGSGIIPKTVLFEYNDPFEIFKITDVKITKKDGKEIRYAEVIKPGFFSSLFGGEKYYTIVLNPEGNDVVFPTDKKEESISASVHYTDSNGKPQIVNQQLLIHFANFV